MPVLQAGVHLGHSDLYLSRKYDQEQDQEGVMGLSVSWCVERVRCAVGSQFASEEDRRIHQREESQFVLFSVLLYSSFSGIHDTGQA